MFLAWARGRRLKTQQNPRASVKKRNVFEHELGNLLGPASSLFCGLCYVYTVSRAAQVLTSTIEKRILFSTIYPEIVEKRIFLPRLKIQNPFSTLLFCNWYLFRIWSHAMSKSRFCWKTVGSPKSVFLPLGIFLMTGAFILFTWCWLYMIHKKSEIDTISGKSVEKRICIFSRGKKILFSTTFPKIVEKRILFSMVEV